MRLKLLVFFLIYPSFVYAGGIYDIYWLNNAMIQQRFGIQNYVEVGERPCMGYGGCTGTGAASGYGKNFNTPEYYADLYQNKTEYQGFWALDSYRMPYQNPYINNTNRNIRFKFQIHQPTNIFNTIPASSSNK